MNSSRRESWSWGRIGGLLPVLRGLQLCWCKAGQAHVRGHLSAALGVEGRYLKGIARLALERDHIIHQVALASLHPVTGHGRFRTTAQAHRYTGQRQTERGMDQPGRSMPLETEVMQAAGGGGGGQEGTFELGFICLWTLG